ncbi:class I SAM-dependent methyltransferase [Novosphingobium sp. AAP93]|uniref:class I SAM-dependent methyltransferase n=1 Tax=Novosphingobium sp. AAP93 TaxID=1523427 RepID=UPI000B1AEC55|nr:rRNA adenine N-6-methyltransferase family protein [Novosphingobium sp. AAP93]
MKLKLKPGIAQKPRQVVDKLASAVRRKIKLKKPRRRGKPKPLRKGPPEALLGFGRFVANPRRFGGFVSGPALAEAITREIEPAAGPVLELGPGTGVFTRALIARGVAERDLILVELDPKLAERLRTAFPEALVLCRKAGSVTADLLEGRRPVAVVSGLPLLNFPDEEVERIIAAAFAVCTPEAALYQFTYGPKCPVSKAIRAELGLSAQRTTRIWRNVPPASVYRIVRD